MQGKKIGKVFVVIVKKGEKFSLCLRRSGVPCGGAAPVFGVHQIPDGGICDQRL